MTDSDPQFDALHPSGHVLFRSCRGGYLHSVGLTEAAMTADVAELARGIVLAAEVSYLKAVLEVRGEIVAAGHTPSADVPGTEDLLAALGRLGEHELTARPKRG